MDILNSVAIVLSFAAVIITLRQTSYARQANHLPLVVDVLREFRSSEFQRDYMYVIRELATQAPSGGLSDVPDDARIGVMNVCYFFQSIAYLVVYEIMNEEQVILVLRSPIKNAWLALRPLIEAERELPEPIGGFRFFEHIAARAIALPVKPATDRKKLWRA
jgi:hypothetical protein